MTNIIRTSSGPSTLSSISAFDPLRSMRELLRWDPFRELGASPLLDNATFMPSFDVKETKEGFTLKADMPGIKENDLTVSLTGNRLHISGRRDAEEKKQGESYYTLERAHGSFTRTFTLPDGIDADKIHAELKDGVFTLMLPKGADTRSKQIQVKAK